MSQSPQLEQKRKLEKAHNLEAAFPNLDTSHPLTPEQKTRLKEIYVSKEI